MDEACGDPSEPDIVLAVLPPAPRRPPWPVPLPSPPSQAAPAVAPPPVPFAPASAALSPPPVPPPSTPEAGGVTEEVPAVEVDDGAAASGNWPDRRWWVSTAVSTVVHVVVLMILALIVPTPDDLRRPRPIEVVQPAPDPEPAAFPDPADLAAVEIEPPAPVDDLAVQEADPVEIAAADAEAVGFDAPADMPVGITEADAKGLAARIGAGAGGGQAGGFGGDVGRRLAAAGAKSGDVQVSLSWDNVNDLDLHVVAPSGERVFFGHRASRCRGMLDVDMNAGGPATREPVENVFWPTKQAPVGEYAVFVHHFARYDLGRDETAFAVNILVNGARQTFTGSVKSGDPPAAVTRFTKRRAGPAAPADEFVE